MIVSAVLTASLVGDAVFLLCNPPLSVAALLAALRFGVMNALWNAALALPLAVLLRRLGWVWEEE